MPESIRNDLKFTLGVKRAYTHGKFLARNHLGDQIPVAGPKLQPIMA